MLAAVTSPACPTLVAVSSGRWNAPERRCDRRLRHELRDDGVGTVAGRYQIAGARRSLTAHRTPLRGYHALQRLIPIERTERPPALFIPFHHHRNIMTGLEGLEIG